MFPKTDGILESSLYVADVARSARFYEKIFGFRVISDFGGRGCAMQRPLCKAYAAASATWPSGVHSCQRRSRLRRESAGRN